MANLIEQELRAEPMNTNATIQKHGVHVVRLMREKRFNYGEPLAQPTSK